MSPMAAPAAVEPTSTTGASAAKSQPTTAPQPTSIPTVVPTTPPTFAYRFICFAKDIDSLSLFNTIAN